MNDEVEEIINCTISMLAMEFEPINVTQTKQFLLDVLNYHGFAIANYSDECISSGKVCDYSEQWQIAALLKLKHVLIESDMDFPEEPNDSADY